MRGLHAMRYVAVVATLFGCSDGERQSGTQGAGASAADSAQPVGGAPFEPAPEPQSFPVDDPTKLPPGTPFEHIQVLYDRGTEPGSLVYDIHADDGAVYWGQTRGRLYRGSQDGTAAPEQIGEWQRSFPGAFGITSDETHVYWLDKVDIYRRPKAGGDTELITLEAEANGFSVSERYLYGAVWGCPLIYRVDKQTLAIESQSIVLDEPGSGPTFVIEDGGEVFCGSWSSVYVVREWGGEAERLTGVADRIEGMVVAGDYVYWLDRHDSGAPTLGRVARKGGSPELFPITDSFMGRGATRLVSEPSGETLWHSSSGGWVVSFSTKTLKYSIRAHDGPIDLAIYDGYIYWTAQVGVNGVKRMPLNAPVVYRVK